MYISLRSWENPRRVSISEFKKINSGFLQGTPSRFEITVTARNQLVPEPFVSGRLTLLLHWDDPIIPRNIESIL